MRSQAGTGYRFEQMLFLNDFCMLSCALIQVEWRNLSFIERQFSASLDWTMALNAQETAMLKTSMIALTLAATIGGAFLATATPAAAHDDWGWHRHHRWHREWRDYRRWDDCRTVVRRYRIWTHHGPEWVVKRVRICD